MILDGRYAAKCIKENLKEEFLKLNKKPCLAVLHFKDDASASYLKGRMKIADEMGVSLITYPLDETMDFNEIKELILKLNQDDSINGIMLDRPLPKQYNEFELLSAIREDKDVDGYTPNNIGKLLSNQDGFASATPSAAIRLLEFYNVDLTGKDALVIGRSINVGKPLAQLLLNKNATVTIAHSKTKNLKEKCKMADIIFLAIGKANFLTKDCINEHTIIVDIGINYDEEGKLCGDASKECYEIVDSYTPVPGGVGVMTNVMLMENLLKACLKHHG